MIALVLIVVLTTPYIVLAERTEWSEDLPEIPSLGVTYDPAATEAYILSTIPDEPFIEQGKAANIYQDLYKREAIEFAWLLFSDKNYSALTESERITSFNQLEIAYEDSELKNDMFTKMEQDGFSFADSVELMRIISTELFEYAEAQIILAEFPRFEERISELSHFEYFTQELETALQHKAEYDSVSPGALRAEPTMSAALNRLQVGINEGITLPRKQQSLSDYLTLPEANPLDEARQMFLSGKSVRDIEQNFAKVLYHARQTRFDFQTVTGNALAMDFLSEYELYDNATLEAAGVAAFGIAPASSNHADIVANPFDLRINTDETVILNTGAVVFRQHILNLPGRGGFGLNLDLVYNSFKTDPNSRIPNSPVRGWAFFSKRNICGK
jgi:hypothetical protein